jgi:hypothetical protein
MVEYSDPSVAKDGCLLVADDTGGTIWRISHTGAKKEAAEPAGGGAVKR